MKLASTFLIYLTIQGGLSQNIRTNHVRNLRSSNQRITEQRFENEVERQEEKFWSREMQASASMVPSEYQ